MKVFATDEHRLDDEYSSIASLVDVKNDLPSQVFVPGFSNFTFINFDDIFTGNFYEKISGFQRQINDDELTVFMLKPDPRLYFYHHFGNYPLMKFPASSSNKEYISALFADPGGSPADAVVYNSSVLLFYSTSLRWVIYGSRDFEVAIFASKDKILVDKFQRIYDKTFDVKSAIQNILEPAWVDQFPAEFRMQLLENYTSI